MTTTVTTITKSAQVFTRTWADLDPKVRNALYVLAADVLASGSAYLLGAISLRGLAAADVPVLLAVVTAYVTTSKHKQLIVAIGADTDAVAHDLAPIVKDIAPAAAPAVDIALDAVDTINAALTPEQTDLTAATAAASDPSPATGVIQAAVLPQPVQ